MNICSFLEYLRWMIIYIYIIYIYIYTHMYICIHIYIRRFLDYRQNSHQWTPCWSKIYGFLLSDIRLMVYARVWDRTTRRHDSVSKQFFLVTMMSSNVLLATLWSVNHCSLLLSVDIDIVNHCSLLPNLIEIWIFLLLGRCFHSK